MSAARLRQLLADGDVEGCRRFWAETMPYLPQLQSYAEAEVSMHMARTSCKSLGLRARAYSHRWLCERDLPSQLPDELKPKAEQICPRVAEAVGISVKTEKDYLKPAMLEVRAAMESAVNEAYADGMVEPAFVQQRMREAKERTLSKLFGTGE